MATKRIIYSQQFSDESFTGGDYPRYKFRKTGHACALMVIMLFRFSCMGNLIVFSDTKANVVHFIAVSAFLFLPILYMFIFIGHYSKLSCPVICRVVPLLNGVGLTIILMSTVELVSELVRATDTFELLYRGLDQQFDWMYCGDTPVNKCIGIDNVEKCAESNCYQSVEQLSLFKYRALNLRQIKFNELPTERGLIQDDLFWSNLVVTKIPILVICIVIVLIINDLDVGTPNINIYIALYVAYLLFMVIATIFITMDTENSGNVAHVLEFRLDSLFNFNTWTHTVLFFAESISLTDVVPVLIGSYLPTTAVTDLQAFIIWIGITVLYGMSEIMSAFLIHSFANQLGTSVDMIRLDASGVMAQHVFFPQAICFMKHSPFTVFVLYAVLSIISSFIRIKILLASMYHTLADIRYVIRTYKFYIRVFSSLFLCIFASPICIVEIYHTFSNLVRYLEVSLTNFILVIITVSVLYFYGVQTLCDDHHFVYGAQPAIFLKLALFAAPVCFTISGATLLVQMTSLYYNEDVIGRICILSFVLLIIPQILGLLYITTFYLKRQNMAHLLRCEDNWGDPNHSTRTERIIYHPRLETNYFRRIDYCKHECLRYNKLLHYIMKDEIHWQIESYDMLKKKDRIFRNLDTKMFRSDTSIL